MRILLVGNVVPVVRALLLGLREGGFTPDLARDDDEARHRVWAAPYEAVILDTLAGTDTLALLRAWRRAGLAAHVLALTPPGRPEDRIRALNEGADDCLGKPIDFDELLARLRALARRAGPSADPVLRSGDLEIDPGPRTVTRAGRPIPLTPREYALLEFLARNRGRVVSRALIWRTLYDDKAEGRSNLVDVYIRYLRNKIDRGFGRPLILTRYGEGYLLRDEDL